MRERPKSSPENSESLRCSFCNKTQKEVKKLLSGPSARRPRVYICNECVAVCGGLLDARKTHSPK